MIDTVTSAIDAAVTVYIATMTAMVLLLIAS